MGASWIIGSGKMQVDAKSLYKRSCTYFRPYRIPYALLSLLGTGGYWALFTCYGFLLREIVMITESPDLVRERVYGIILYLFLALLISPLSGFAIHGIKWVEERIAGDMRTEILNGYLYADEREAESYSTDDVQQRMTTDVSSVAAKLFGFTFFGLVAEPVLAGMISIAVVAAINPLLALLCIVCACISLNVSQLWQDKSSHLKRQVVNEDQEIVHSVLQAEDGRYEVHQFRMRDSLISALRGKMDQYGADLTSFEIIVRRRDAIGSFFGGAVSIVALLTAGSLLSSNHLMQFADVMVAMPMIDQIAQMMTGFGRWKTQIKEQAESEKRIFEIADLKKSRNVTKTGENISLDHVSFSYDGAQFALKDCSLKILKNQHAAIVGENGSGKSTVLKLMLGLLQPSSGTLTVPGQDQISYMAQDCDLFRAPIKEYIALSSQADENQLALASKLSGSIGFIEEKGGFEKPISNDEFSGGQKQRLSLTRSIYSDRPYQFFDEPSAAMDQASEKRLKELIDSEREKTIVVVTHRLDLIMNFDIIYVLKDHQVAECGTHEELMRKNGVYAEMVRKQQSPASD